MSAAVASDWEAGHLGQPETQRWEKDGPEVVDGTSVTCFGTSFGFQSGPADWPVGAVEEDMGSGQVALAATVAAGALVTALVPRRAVGLAMGSWAQTA